MKLGPYTAPGAYFGDCRALLREVPDGSVQACVTSPPYWGLRRYLPDGHPDAPLELGAEDTPAEYVERMVEVFAEVRRCLRDDGTLWLNLGDSYAGSWGAQSRASTTDANEMTSTLGGSSARQMAAAPKGAGTGSLKRTPGLKNKDLVGIPWRVALALQADGWYLRADIVWHKLAPMPESVSDRPTRAHEFVFLLTKSERYYYDAHAIREPSTSTSDAGNGYARPHRETVDGVHAGQAKKWTRDEAGGTRNCRDVWTLGPEPRADAHFAVMPTALVKPCILAGAPAGAVVLDPFFGSGTVGRVAEDLGRNWLGFDLNPAYGEIQRRRTAQTGLVLDGAA